MKCLILNLLERMKCYKCLFTRSKSEYWLLHSKILQWFYNVKYSKSCLSFIVVPILNYLKIQLLIEALGPLPVILSLQTFLQAYLIGEFIIFFKDPKVLILYISLSVLIHQYMHTSVGEGPESWWDIYYSMKYDVNNCLTDPHISGDTCLNVIIDGKSFLFLKLTSHVKVVMKL